MNTSKIFVFFSPDHTTIPLMSEDMIDKFSRMKLNESVSFNNVNFTICLPSCIPDSRNKFGRPTSGFKCVLVNSL